MRTDGLRINHNVKPQGLAEVDSDLQDEVVKLMKDMGIKCNDDKEMSDVLLHEGNTVLNSPLMNLDKAIEAVNSGYIPPTKAYHEVMIEVKETAKQLRELMAIPVINRKFLESEKVRLEREIEDARGGLLEVNRLIKWLADKEFEALATRNKPEQGV